MMRHDVAKATVTRKDPLLEPVVCGRKKPTASAAAEKHVTI